MVKITNRRIYNYTLVYNARVLYVRVYVYGDVTRRFDVIVLRTGDIRFPADKTTTIIVDT